MKETHVADRITLPPLLIVVIMIIMTGCQPAQSGTNVVSYDSVELEISLKYPSQGIMEKRSPLNLKLSFENVGQIEILSRDFTVLSPFTSNNYLDDGDANLVKREHLLTVTTWSSLMAQPSKSQDYETSIMEMRTLFLVDSLIVPLSDRARCPLFWRIGNNTTRWETDDNSIPPEALERPRAADHLMLFWWRYKKLHAPYSTEQPGYKLISYFS